LKSEFESLLGLPSSETTKKINLLNKIISLTEKLLSDSKIRLSGGYNKIRNGKKSAGNQDFYTSSSSSIVASAMMYDIISSSNDSNDYSSSNDNS
jgi:hypothetical protein